MSASQYYGIDFGTSNSSVSINLDGVVKTLPIGDGVNKEVVETAMYFRNGEISFFDKAVIKYLEEIREQRPTGIHVDYNVGRLIRSFKSALGRKTLSRTNIGGRVYDLVEIVGLFLDEIKRLADESMNEKIDRVVLGRPVKFVSETDDMDEICNDRLINAAKLAGFKHVSIKYEPVAAAYSFHQKDKVENVVVFDFGGGTLDISVVSFDGKDSKVLAVSGESLGGDNLDMELYDLYLAKYFGKDLKYKDGKLDYPRSAVEQIVDWSKIVNLRNEEFLAFLKQIYPSTSSQSTVKYIEDFLIKNLTYSLREEIVKAKIGLSTQKEVLFSFETKLQKVVEKMRKESFEDLLSQDKETVMRLVEDAVRKSGLKINQIDVVVMTGGSSLIPLVQKWLAGMFVGTEIKIHNPFSAISKGLAVMNENIF